MTGLVAGATAAGAAGAASGPDEPSGEDRTERVRIAIAGYENNLTPFRATFQSGVTMDLINMLYDTLFYSPWERDPKPWLAEHFEVSNEGRTHTIRIRDGVRWHDGKPLTAEDVRFTYEYFSEHEQALYSHHVNHLPSVDTFELVDDDTVRFTCREPCPTFTTDPGALIPIIPKHVWKDVTDPAKPGDARPVGSGPYKFAGDIPAQRYTLRANDDYFLGRPLVSEIELPIIPAPSAMFGALRSGTVDAVSQGIAPETVSSLQNAGLEVLKLADYKSTQINFNVQRPPFDSTDFRNALNLAVDTRPITRTILADRGQPGVESFLDPDSPFAAEDVRDKYDVQAAARLLAQRGYRDGDGDGVRERPDGGRLDFDVLVSSAEPQEIRAGELVSRQLAKVGVRTRLVPLDPPALRARLQPPEPADGARTAAQKTGDYDMYVSTTSEGGHVHVDPDGLLYYFHCPGKTGFGTYITGYCNNRFDRLVERAARLGFQERVPLLQAAQRVLYDDPPVISLYFAQGTYAYRPEAYTGWAPEVGHGIIHKRSFIPTAGTQRVGSRDPGDGGGSSPIWPFVVAGLVVFGGGAVVLARRRRRAGAPPA